MADDKEGDPPPRAAPSGTTNAPAAGDTGTGLSRSLLEQLLQRSPVGMTVVDTDLRCLWSNAALEQFAGGTAQQRLGRRLGELQPHLNAEKIEAKLRQVLETGVPVIDYLHVGHPWSALHVQSAFSLSFVRLDDDQGSPLGVQLSVFDVTARYRTRLRLALLDRAGRHIGRALDVMQTAQDLADVAVPELADFVVVDLLDAVIEGEETVPGVITGADTVTLRRCGYQSAIEDAPETLVEIGEAAVYHASSPPIYCLTSGVSWREAQLDPFGTAWAVSARGGRPTRFLDVGLHSSMVVPIRARGVTLGIATFFRAQSDEPFDEADLRLAVEFVDRAAVCIDNARRYLRERNAALVLQRSLLPLSGPRQQAVDVASRYRPADALAELGGNWFDVIPLSGARVALVVGDVAGHGLDAAATMGRLRTAVQTLADLDLSPEELLARLDDLVCRDSREESAATQGATCLYVVYDPIRGKCAMASAGHPPPAIIGPDGSVDLLELPLGPALGVGGMPFESVGFALAEGSVIGLYTDGLLAPHARDGGARSRSKRLLVALERRGLSLDSLCETTVDTLLPERPADDATLLLARTRVLDEERVASWDLPTDPAFVARAREMAAEQLGAWGLDDLVFTTELVVSELVTNAIRHASGPIRLRLIRDLALICEVSDASSTSPHLRHPRTTDEGGRGLFLISQFTERWGTRYTPEGKIIWAEQALPDAA